MASSNRLRSFAALVAIMLAIWAVPALHAQDNFKELRKEVAELEKKLTDTEKSLHDANAKVSDNIAAQAKAPPEKLQALKAEGRRLGSEAAKAQEARDKARSTLASKQGELRAAASTHATEQVAAKSDIAIRLQEILKAIDTWSTTLGPLPPVPALRDTTALDPEAARATIEGDRARLDEFDKWAEGEEGRLKVEVERADKLIGAETSVKDADNGPEMVKQAKALKETLQKRQQEVSALRKKAADSKKKLK
jgi:hypothetical protein